MKTSYIAISLVVLALIAGFFLFGTDLIGEQPQVCFLEPLTPTAADLVYSCEDLDEANLTQEDIDHDELVNYSLELINTDRATYNLNPVVLGTSSLAQEHAELNANLCKTTHWDSNGMKPYMRYTKADGKGAIMENTRVIGTPDITKYWTEESLKQIIAWNEYSMVERDEANSWVNSQNILLEINNYVNIGIAWNSYCISIVQQFETNYIDWKQFPIITHSDQLILSGEVSFNATIEQIDIFFDPTPNNLSDEQLMFAPNTFNFGHQCTLSECTSNAMATATILPNYSKDLTNRALEDLMNADSQIPIFVATEWETVHSEDSVSFQIEEDVTQLTNGIGSGVYTIMLWVSVEGFSDGIVLTTISIFL